MFQYAAARRLGLVNDAELHLIAGEEYRQSSFRAYGLGHFPVAGRLHDPPIWQRRLARGARSLWGAFAGPRSGSGSAPLLEDANVVDLARRSKPQSEPTKNPNLVFVPRVLAARGSFRLVGHWQDERYFADVAEVIRRDFSSRPKLDARSRAALVRIRAGPSAFIHVRRGDYLSSELHDVFGTCSARYYRSAVDVLQAQPGEAPALFVFSNDPRWVREERIGGAAAEIVDWNGAHPERDLALMRECRHAVIANSTFSWWGAWLGDGAPRVVIAPATWLRGLPEFDDIVPGRWLRIEN